MGAAQIIRNLARLGCRVPPRQARLSHQDPYLVENAAWAWFKLGRKTMSGIQASLKSSFAGRPQPRAGESIVQSFSPPAMPGRPSEPNRGFRGCRRTGFAGQTAAITACRHGSRAMASESWKGNWSRFLFHPNVNVRRGVGGGQSKTLNGRGGSGHSTSRTSPCLACVPVNGESVILAKPCRQHRRGLPSGEPSLR